MFENIRQSDTRRNATLSWTQVNYDYGPNGTLVNPRYVTSIQKSSNRIGDQTVMLYTKTKNWKRGRFAVYPVNQRSVKTFCTSGTLKSQRLFGGKLYPSQEITGDLGAWLGIPSAGSITTGPTEYPEIGSNLQGRATASASQASLEAGVMIGELHETLSMLINPLNGLCKLLIKHPIPRKLRLKNTLRSLRKDTSMSLSNWWLQYRFGIMPFLNDIANIHKLCSRQVLRVSPIQHARAVTSTGPVLTRESLAATLFNVPVWGDIYTHVSSRIIATVYYNRFQWQMLERVGLDWSQVPGILWELIPFSFLVDRVVNVGQWLEIMRPKQDFSILGTTISYKDISERVYHAKSANLISGSPSPTSIDLLCKTTAELYSRTLPGPLPSGPVVNINVSGLMKTLDHLTLLNQRILTKMR